MYIGFHVKYPLFLLYFNKTWFSGQIIEKFSNIKYHENLSSGSCAVWMDRQMDRHDEANSFFPQICEHT